DKFIGSLEEFDSLFLTIYLELKEKALMRAQKCTEEVFNLSCSFISRSAQDVLRRFHDLYFAGGFRMEDQKEVINKEVDNIIDQIQTKLESGENSESLKDIKEDETLKVERLGLAGIQKRLEGLITLESGIRDKILPSLSSMQFEDAVCQRLDHIEAAWNMVLNRKLFEDETRLEETSREIAELCSSIEETEIYYTIVLKEEPPKGGANPTDILYFR
ncbi:MAG: hypothetical protein HQK54_17720, partial [Oligoflexales bacterium]|nr:hypothetical protein [Oligoflexales bacterium]